MLKYSDQPVMYLQDLPSGVEIKIPPTMHLAQKAFDELMDGCQGLRCPKCGEDKRTCLASPSVGDI